MDEMEATTRCSVAAVVTLSEMEVGIARPPPSPPLWPREIKTINKLIGYFRFVCFPSAFFLFIFFLSFLSLILLMSY